MFEQDEKKRKNVVQYEELKQFLLKDVGKGEFKDSQYEEIIEQKDDFYMEEQPEQDSHHDIKTMQFNSTFVMSSSSKNASNNKEPLNLLGLSSCSYRSGYNSAFKQTIISLPEGKICIAFGVNIIFQNIVYSQHQYNVCLLYFDEKEQVLYSGSEGNCPEIISWKYFKNKSSNYQLQYMNRWHQFRRSIAVNFLHIFHYADQQQENAIITTIDKYSIHKSCSLYVFDQQNNQRYVCGQKIGKVIDSFAAKIPANQELYQMHVLNQTGLLHIQISCENQITHVIKNQQFTAGCLLNSKSSIVNGYLCILADRNGCINIYSKSQYKKALKQNYKLHEGWIFLIKNISQTAQQDIFVSSGLIDRKIIFFSTKAALKSDSWLQIVKLKQFDLAESYVNNICWSQRISLTHEQKSTSTIRCGLKNGKIFSYQRKNNSIDLITEFQKENSLCANDQYSPQHIQLKQLLYNKYTNKYYQITKLSKQVSIFQANSKQTQQSNGMNIKISKENDYLLKEKPTTSDVFGTFIAYIYEQHKANEKQMKSSMNMSMMKSKLFKKSNAKQQKVYYLIVEDIFEKQMKQKILVVLPSQQSGQSQVNQQSGNMIHPTVMKYNSSGGKLAIGLSNGCVLIYNSIKIKEYCFLCMSEQINFHQNAIQDIIWSIDDIHFKTNSQGELFYHVLEQDTKHKSYKISKCKTIQVKDTLWTEPGKYGWETKYIWSEMSLPSDVIAIKSTNQYIIVCMSDGTLRIYRNQAIKGQYKQFKLFSAVDGEADCEYSVMPMQAQEGEEQQYAELNMMVVWQNMMMILKFEERQEVDEDEDEDGVEVDGGEVEESNEMEGESEMKENENEIEAKEEQD